MKIKTCCDYLFCEHTEDSPKNVKRQMWEYRFDEEILYPNGKENGRHNCMSNEDEKNLKSFINSLLFDVVNNDRLNLINKIQNIQGNYNCRECGSEAYDSAISDVVDLISKS